jgi:hypothetical protein
VSFDPECSQAIQKAQNLLKKKELKHDLIYIKCHFKKIVESITQLEKTDLPLTESIGIVENIQKMLQKAPGSVAAIACKKLVTCLEKNEGFQHLHKLSKIFAGERADEDDCSAKDLMFLHQLHHVMWREVFRDIKIFWLIIVKGSLPKT